MRCEHILAVFVIKCVIYFCIVIFNRLCFAAGGLISRFMILILLFGWNFSYVRVLSAVVAGNWIELMALMHIIIDF